MPTKLATRAQAEEAAQIENPKIKEQNANDTKTTFFNNITDTVSDVLLYTGILTGAVVTGLLLTNMSKR